MDIEAIQEKLRRFAKERDWEQFHSPKNLVMALIGEAGELVEVFRWLTEEQSKSVANDPRIKAKAEEEIADVSICLLQLCDKLGVDLDAAIERKLELNATKYPVNLAKGRSTKSTDFN